MTSDVFLSDQESDDADETEGEVEVEVEGVDDLDLSNNGQTGGIGSNTIPRVLKVNQIDSDGVDADYCVPSPHESLIQLILNKQVAVHTAIIIATSTRFYYFEV